MSSLLDFLFGDPAGKTAAVFKKDPSDNTCKMKKENGIQYLKKKTENIDFEDVGVKFVVVVFEWSLINCFRNHQK